MKRTLLIGIGAVIVGAASFQAVAAADSEPAGERPTPRVATLPVTDETFSANAMAEIKRRSGSFAPLAHSSSAQISRAEALMVAGSEFGFLHDAKSASAQLGIFTAGKYGQQLESDPTKPSRITPLIHDRLVWLVEVHGFTMPEFGPIAGKDGKPVRSNPPAVGGSDGLFAVDAVTGKFLTGDQYSSTPADNVGD